MVPPGAGLRCLRCGAPVERQGRYRTDDGRGRFWCSHCAKIWWLSPPADEVPRVATWDATYGVDLTEEHFQAVVEADLRRFGYHTPTRHYQKPAEPPATIWLEAGLPVVEGGPAD
jgi:Zinc finger found in FPG and IleRS